MKLPVTPQSYDRNNEQQTRGQIERGFVGVFRFGEPVILQAPDGSLWQVEVDNSGNLSTSAV